MRTKNISRNSSVQGSKRRLCARHIPWNRIDTGYHIPELQITHIKRKAIRKPVLSPSHSIVPCSIVRRFSPPLSFHICLHLPKTFPTPHNSGPCLLAFPLFEKSCSSKYGILHKDVDTPCACLKVILARRRADWRFFQVFGGQGL